MPRTRRPLFGFLERITDASYPSLLLVWAGMILLFALAYFSLSVSIPAHGIRAHHEDITGAGLFWNSIYYAIITATTVGYGDITPFGFSKVLASIESIIAFLIFAVFVTKLVSFRQDIALRQIHKLTFEDVFESTREGFFIIRKDFDAVIAEAESLGSLPPHRWENLLIAFRTGQTLLEQIPDFYNTDQHLYTIDIRRERLLQEAVHRTLHRINQVLDTLSRKGIRWADQERITGELAELVHMVEIVTPLWREKSPHGAVEPFEDILLLSQGIHRHIEEAMPKA